MNTTIPRPRWGDVTDVGDGFKYRHAFVSVSNDDAELVRRATVEMLREEGWELQNAHADRHVVRGRLVPIPLTAREKNIVRAALHLQKVNREFAGHVPDFELLVNQFGLPVDEMRQIRDIVQAAE